MTEKKIKPTAQKINLEVGPRTPRAGFYNVFLKRKVIYYTSPTVFLYTPYATYKFDLIDTPIKAEVTARPYKLKFSSLAGFMFLFSCILCVVDVLHNVDNGLTAGVSTNSFGFDLLFSCFLLIIALVFYIFKSPFDVFRARSFLQHTVAIINFLGLYRIFLRDIPREQLQADWRLAAEGDVTFFEAVIHCVCSWVNTYFNLSKFSFLDPYVDEGLLSIYYYAPQLYEYIWNYDGYTVILLTLTNLILAMCVVNIPVSDDKSLLYYLIFAVLTISLQVAFTAINVFIFYLAFELTVIPTLLLIVYGGVHSKKNRAIRYFVAFTVLGSFLLLLAIFLWFLSVDNSCSLTSILGSPELNSKSETYQHCLFLLLLIGFAIKIPIFPFFNWLPEVHVEAPTEGSVILAALLLKLGFFGIVRYCFLEFPQSFEYYASGISAFATVSMVLAAASVLIQTDMKRIVAYSSIVHMSLAVLGLATQESEAVVGALLNSFTHGLVSAGLFFLIGFLYKRYGLRDVDNFGGLAVEVPMFTIYFFLFNLANLGFPLTAPFIAELLIFVGVYAYSPIFFIFLFFPFLTTLFFTVVMFTRVCLGVSQIKSAGVIRDLDEYEDSLIFFLFVAIILVGVFPQLFLKLLGTLEAIA